MVKLDLTSYWLYRNAIVFSYERALKNKPFQTWSVVAGLQEFPSVVGNISNSVNVSRESKASGLKLGGEYRFYLIKENKFKAPHGVFIGPYASFHNYSNQRSIEVNNGGVLEYADLDTDLNVINIGVQLGYQFVLNNRWTVDMVFIGPSFSNYSITNTLGGNYSFDPDAITNEVILALMERFPKFEDLINEGEIKANGKVDSWGYGYRYQLMVGYHFGRK